MTENPKPRLVSDIWDAILNDSWMWIVVWGPPRVGKSTVQLDIGYEVYKDWDQVLQSIVYNLVGILYKMDNGIPCRIMTRNMLHERVPLIIADDFGAMCNKAKTQHEPAWDIFKGAFDTLGTKIGVMMASMGTPTAPTQQLQEKYTHEVYVQDKGIAKYDKVKWQQNFAGWQPRQDKEWIETFRFNPIPLDVYKEYDQGRMQLVDELEQLIKDSMAENQVVSVIRRMHDSDFQLLELLHKNGCVTNDWVNKDENAKYKEALMRCKSRSLVLPVKKGHHYLYDITDFGLEVLQTHEVLLTQNPKALLPRLPAM